MLQKLNELATGAKIGIMIALAAMIIAAGYYAPSGVSSLMDKNKADADTLAAKIAENQKLEQYVTKQRELESQIEQLKGQMALQKEIVPDEKQADKFIILLQQTATSAGVNLRKITAGQTSKKEYYTEVPYTVELDGPYYGVLNFFEKLSGQTRIVNVEGLSMKTLSKGQFNYGPTDSVSVGAVAKTFFSNEANADNTSPAAPAKK